MKKPNVLGNISLSDQAFSFGEPIVPQLEHLFKGIFKTYERLKELGFTYYQGTVSIIAMEGEPDV